MAFQRQIFWERKGIMDSLSNILFIGAILLFIIGIVYFEIGTRKLRKSLKTKEEVSTKRIDKRGIYFLISSAVLVGLSLIFAVL
ncbi:MAG: hypothetical protein PWQ77_314 [Kosmotogales bacterium]|nr:hypothetical protein [Kosmotogales bacterium]